MIGGSGESISPELDPLPTASAGAALAGVASLLWPELIAAAVSLAVLASFVIWIRGVRALRRRPVSGYDPGRLLPLLLVGGTGWSAAVLVTPVFPEGRPLILGAFSVGLWALARPAFVGA